MIIEGYLTKETYRSDQNWALSPIHTNFSYKILVRMIYIMQNYTMLNPLHVVYLLEPGTAHDLIKNVSFENIVKQMTNIFLNLIF